VVTDSAVTLWDAVKGKELRQFGGQKVFAPSAALSPDGKLLAAGTLDGGVRLWDVATGTVLCEAHGHRGQVNTVAFTADGKWLASAGVDTTTLIWDVARIREERREGRPPELRALWQDLAAEDAGKAFEAAVGLSATPAETVALLKDKLRPAAPADAQQIARLIGDLEGKQFGARQKAMQELEKLGHAAEPALRKALADGPMLELRQRIEQLLQKLEGPITSPELLRNLRALEVLEQLGTAEARGLLEALAKGAPGHRMTEEARAALRRLAGRPVAP
jgi:hypothetical protein